MALEAVVFSEDPLTSYTCCSKEYNLYSNYLGMDYDFTNYSSLLLLEDNNQKPFTTNDGGIFDVINSNASHNTVVTLPVLPEISHRPEIHNENINQWEHHTQTQQQYNNNVLYDYSSSPEEYLSGEVPPPAVVVPTVADGGVRRKRRRRSCKNKEEVEQQRMTHIAVERNRRKQMNDYLASIRSLMPPSYVQRGDQASIVGGAINYVKELEQMLQSLEAQKRNKAQHSDNQHQHQDQDQEENKNKVDDNIVPNSSEATNEAQVFADFFSFPQYSTRSSQAAGSNSVSSNSAVGEIEVTMVETHANIKILAKKQPKQLVKLIAAFQALRLNVLHLNVTTLHSFVLYSLSLKVEEECHLNSVDDIAAAANHILAQIQEEAAALL